MELVRDARADLLLFVVLNAASLVILADLLAATMLAAMGGALSS